MDDEKKSLAQRIAEIKPTIEVEARVDTYGQVGDESDNDHRKLRHARYKKSVQLLQKEVDNFDREEAASRVLKSMKADLAVQRAELLKSEAEMDAAGIKYDGSDAKGDGDSEGDGDEDGEDHVAKGNPYAVVKDGEKWKVVKQSDGTVKGTHTSRKKAMKQFRLLEGVEHGGKPTGKKATK